jgi:glutamate/tyrosine decarboxylase-like PLP-dependent enzyme
MATFEIAPMATLIERKLIETMNEYVGYSDGEGIMLTGGSNANLMAMLIARHKKDPELKQTGVSKKALVAFISEEAHYSFDKGCIMMGFGRDNLILVKADDNGTMDIVDLEKKIIDQKEIGKQPFFIGATAGTTVYGAFDPMDEISDIAKKYECWFHIDGAWGGSLLLSNKAKVLLKGCEKSDSFTWDAHKMMGVPIISSFFLCRHKGVMRETNTSGGSDYIFHETENSSYDTGPQSLQCGRKVDALKVWLNFIHHGRNGMEKRIDCLIEKTKYLRTKVIENPNTELMLEPSSINLCFRFINSDKLNEYNLKIREALVTQGEFLTNYARDKNGSVFFRHIFTHPETTNDEIDKFFERLNILADEFK